MDGRGGLGSLFPEAAALDRLRGCFRMGPTGFGDPVGEGLHPELVELLSRKKGRRPSSVGVRLGFIEDSWDRTPGREEIPSNPRL